MKNNMTKRVASALGRFIFVAAVAVCMAGCGKETMVAGGFSVGGGRQVKFAKGNVYYDLLFHKFGIYNSQTEFAGGYNQLITDTSYHGRVDLFGWGTADNPTLISQKDEDYTTFTDWGGKVGGNWRTLTKDEWRYIMKERPDAKKKYAYARVDNRTGVVLLPDMWTLPDSCVFFPGMSYIDSNDYDVRMWKKMEDAGAVFLPSASYRVGTEITSFTGRYWTATEDFTNGAWGFAFSGNGKAGVVSYNHRYYGFAVRLVEDVK